MKPTYSFLGSLIVLVCLVMILGIRIGPAPPLGAFFSPFEGFWANAETSEPSNTAMPVDSLQSTASVYVDSLGIPHIFAENEYDLYFLQGYLEAKDRLFQMELQIRAAGGYLSEWLGEQTLEYDRFQRKMGMTYGAEQFFEEVRKDRKTIEAVSAYTAGVNSYIRSLDRRDYPLEYKILDVEPSEWKAEYAGLLLQYMAQMLAGRSDDLRNSNTRARWGKEFMDEIIYNKPDSTEPVIPAGTEWGFNPELPRPPREPFTPSIVDEPISFFNADPANGSNSWAVDGSKTASGYPIMSNDPHLGLSLPSIWYPLQLTAPGINAMGFTLMGMPAITIGFNEHIGWGSTNVGADVIDFYEITFRDSGRAEYMHGGEWKPVDNRVEEIKVRGGKAVTDTVRYTHHGPIVSPPGREAPREWIPAGHAMRWVAHEPSNELKFFLELLRAENYSDFTAALEHFTAPAQNWIYADSAHVAIWAQGKYPLRWEEQGRYISDGSDSAYDWQGWIPQEHLPHIKNPDRNFVSSANQQTVDDQYPYFFDFNQDSYERGKRINRRLAEMDSITVDDMRRLQMDSFSYHAATLLPELLSRMDPDDTLSGTERHALQLLEEWDYYNDAAAIAPTVFHAWWEHLEDAIWDDEYNAARVPLIHPRRDQTVELIRKDPDARWFDDISTGQTETLDDLVLSSFHVAVRDLEEKHGAIGDHWRWGLVNAIDFDHVGQIPGLGLHGIEKGGGAESVNANRGGGHGPSVRMVVEFSPDVKAYGVFPGGVSGNPGSPFYDSMVDDWAEGKLHRLQFMHEEPPADSVRYRLKFEPLNRSD